MGYVGSHIWQIRQQYGWGTKPLLVPGVAIVIENAAGQVLLGKRADNNLWSIIGGATELGDSLLTTMQKELKEETNLTAEAYQVFGIMSDPQQTYIKYDHGDELCGVDTLFHVTQTTGDLQATDAEHTGFAWFAPHELPVADMMPIAKYTLDMFLEYKKTGQFQLN